MFELFSELRGLLHVAHVSTDCWVFRLHYRLTTTCMLAFSIIISASQYVGNPIDCIHTNDIPEVGEETCFSFLVLTAAQSCPFQLTRSKGGLIFIN